MTTDMSAITTPLTPPVVPVVNAGADQSGVTAQPLTLTGSMVDGGVFVCWEQTSGPGTAVFAADESLITDVTFDQPGTYVLRLTDDASGVFDELSVDMTLQINFGAASSPQPAGYERGLQNYSAMGRWGYTNDPNNSTVPQDFDRGSSSDPFATVNRVDAYYNGSAWVYSPLAALRYRVDVPNGTFTVDTYCGDSAVFALGSHTAFVEVSGNGGASWASIHNGVSQTAVISNPMSVDVTTGHLLFRFGQESGGSNTHRTALLAIHVGV